MAEENAPAPAAQTVESAASSAPPSSSGGGGKLVLILTLANLVVTAAIAGVLVVSFQKEKSKVTMADVEAGAHGGHSDAPATGAKDGHGAPAAEAKKLTQFGKMLNLEQFTVNLASAGTVNPKFIRVNISLEIPAAEIEQELQQKMPRVRNVIIDLFNAKKASDVASPEGRDFLKDEIRNALNSFLVSGKIKGVFFTNFALSG